MKLLKEFRNMASAIPCVDMAVARAEDKEVLEAISECYSENIINPVLVGDRIKIEYLLEELGINHNFRIIDADSDEDVIMRIVALVENGEVAGIIKGLINTAIFTSAILKSKSINKKKFINHMGAYQVEGVDGIFFVSDSGINVLPSLEEKEKILVNCTNAIKNLGIEMPKVAMLSANELISNKMPSTVHADVLARKYNGKGMIVEGPIAFDVALSRDAAEHKGLDSKVSGDVDLYVFPNIEAGNIVGKSWLYLNQAKWCGIVLGCEIPIVMGSRADTMENKINSIALAKLAANQ